MTPRQNLNQADQTRPVLRNKQFAHDPMTRLDFLDAAFVTFYNGLELVALRIFRPIDHREGLDGTLQDHFLLEPLFVESTNILRVRLFHNRHVIIHTMRLLFQLGLNSIHLGGRGVLLLLQIFDGGLQLQNRRSLLEDDIFETRVLVLLFEKAADRGAERLGGVLLLFFEALILVLELGIFHQKSLVLLLDASELRELRGGGDKGGGIHIHFRAHFWGGSDDESEYVRIGNYH